MNSKPKSLYVHIPFCEHICSYCNFTKIFYKENIVDSYLERLEQELSSFNIESLKTIYIGGGTPSSLNIMQLEKLLKMFSSIKLEKNYEYSIEANPENLSEEKIKLLAKYGINRISLGIQTFDEKLCKLLNRKHNYQMVKEVVNNLNKYNIRNYSFDFIYAIPFQTKETINHDIDLAIELGPKHLSFYSLLIEENTLLYLQNHKEAEDSLQREMYDFIYEKLKDNNYKRYEISNFALPGFESQHNKTYWLDNCYYAIGLSASGYVDNIRYTNTKNLTNYLKGVNKKTMDIINKEDEKFEYIMLNLRLDQGINMLDYQHRFNEEFIKTKREKIDKLLKEKLIIIENNNLKTTYQGSMLLHRVIESLI